MKVILDTNIWISFLLGHQAKLMRRILTDSRYDVYVYLYLLSLAESIEATYIVSGDADLTTLHHYKDTQIIRLADFKEMMLYS